MIPHSFPNPSVHTSKNMPKKVAISLLPNVGAVYLYLYTGKRNNLIFSRLDCAIQLEPGEVIKFHFHLECINCIVFS